MPQDRKFQDLPKDQQEFVGGKRPKSYESDEAMQRKAAEDEYAKSQGATGIAGAAKRSRPEYKAGLAEFLKKRKPKTMPGDGTKPEAETMPVRTSPMPKGEDYPDIKDYEAAMRSWREQQRTAKDAAGALAGRSTR
jgi:hypothetical protein